MGAPSTVSTTVATTGTTQNHKNSAQTTAASSSAFGKIMLALPAFTEALYDAIGQHLGGVYSPLLADGQLTAEYAECLASRPAELLVWQDGLCPEPRCNLGLVWMMPAPSPSANPLAASPAVLPYLVQVLDAGQSVALHAASQSDIAATCAVLPLFIGGGHA